MRNILDSAGKLASCIAYDIETRSDDRTDEYLDKYKQYEAPSNYKNQEVIDKYIKNAKDKDRAKAPLYIPTQNVWVICAEHVGTGERVSFESRDEREVVRHFFNYLHDYDDSVIFGFNTATFDVPCLYGAALRHGLSVPKQLRHPNLQSDILQDFYHAKVRLNDLAFCIGESKLMDGGSVEQAWLSYVMSNDLPARDKIVEYCTHDTYLCAEYVRRVYLGVV